MNIADVGSILSPAITLSQVNPSIFSVKQVLGSMVPKTRLKFSLYALGLAIPIIPNWSGIYYPLLKRFECHPYSQVFAM